MIELPRVLQPVPLENFDEFPPANPWLEAAYNRVLENTINSLRNRVTQQEATVFEERAKFEMKNKIPDPIEEEEEHQQLEAASTGVDDEEKSRRAALREEMQKLHELNEESLRQNFPLGTMTPEIDRELFIELSAKWREAYKQLKLDREKQFARRWASREVERRCPDFTADPYARQRAGSFFSPPNSTDCVDIIVQQQRLEDDSRIPTDPTKEDKRMRGGGRTSADPPTASTKPTRRMIHSVRSCRPKSVVTLRGGREVPVYPPYALGLNPTQLGLPWKLGRPPPITEAFQSLMTGLHKAAEQPNIDGGAPNTFVGLPSDGQPDIRSSDSHDRRATTGTSRSSPQVAYDDKLHRLLTSLVSDENSANVEAHQKKSGNLFYFSPPSIQQQCAQFSSSLEGEERSQTTIQQRYATLRCFDSIRESNLGELQSFGISQSIRIPLADDEELEELQWNISAAAPTTDSIGQKTHNGRDKKKKGGEKNSTQSTSTSHTGQDDGGGAPTHFIPTHDPIYQLLGLFNDRSATKEEEGRRSFLHASSGGGGFDFLSIGILQGTVGTSTEEGKQPKVLRRQTRQCYHHNHNNNIIEDPSLEGLPTCFKGCVLHIPLLGDFPIAKMKLQLHKVRNVPTEVRGQRRRIGIGAFV